MAVHGPAVKGGGGSVGGREFNVCVLIEVVVGTRKHILVSAFKGGGGGGNISTAFLVDWEWFSFMLFLNLK